MYPNPAVAPNIVWEGTTFTVTWQVIDPTTGQPAAAPTVTGVVSNPDGTGPDAMTVTTDADDSSIVRASYITTMAGTHAYTLTSTGPAQLVQGYAVALAALFGVQPIDTDPTSPTGAVRLLISDIDPAAPIFTDAQIAGYLTVAASNRFLAAAFALEAIAASEVLVSKKITTQDLQTDGPAVAKELRALAAQMRKNADEVDEDGELFAAYILPFDTSCSRRW